RRAGSRSRPSESKMRGMRRSFSAFLALAVVAVAGCSAPSADPTWDELDRDARLEYMAEVVLPTMREIFQAHDPQRYAAFSCSTCHGEDLVDVDYAMPNALAPLPLDDTLAQAEALDPEMTAFMLDEVFPVMAELLGREKYNHDAAPDGFRCVGCHRGAE